MTTQPATVALADAIREVFPSMDWRRALAIARHYHDTPAHYGAHVHAGTEHITCLVAAHVRHNMTDYDSRFIPGRGHYIDNGPARAAVQPIITRQLLAWSLKVRRIAA